MIILALDASAGPGSVCLMEDGLLRGHLFQNTGLTHSQTLLPMVDQLLKLTGLTLSQVDGIAVTGGPGSFTGLRIGLAAAKGLALGAGKGLCPVSTLAAMAEPLRPFGLPVCAVMDARRGQVYNALFDETGRRLCPDRAVAAESLEEELKNLGNEILLVGDGTMLCYNKLKELVPGLRPAPDHLQCQNALGAALWTWRRGGAFQDPETVVPTYLRLSQAERERLAREGQK